MRTVASKGLIARPVRTILTTLAIVLGVAMVSGALTLTDTMRGGADGLTAGRLRRHRRRRRRPRPRSRSTSTDCATRRPTIDASLLERVRAVPQVAAAVGDITDEAKIIARDGKPAGDGPYFGVGFDAAHRGRQGHHAVPARHGPLGHRARRGRHRRRPPPPSSTTASARPVRIAAHGTAAGLRRRRHRPLRHREVARHGDRRRVRPAHRAGRCSARRAATTRSSPSASDGTAGADVRKAVAAAVGSGAQVDDRQGAGPLHPRRAEDVHLDHHDRPARLRPAWPSSSARSRSSTRSRSRSPSARASSGCCGWSARRAARCSASVLLEALAIGVLASLIGLGAGFGIAKGLDAVFASMDMDLPDAGMVFATRTIVVVDAGRHARHARRRPGAGLAGDPRAARGRPARRRAGLGARSACRPAPCAAARLRRSAAWPSASAAPPAGSRAATRCATPAAPPSPPRR